jgi:hypothetical protein
MLTIQDYIPVTQAKSRLFDIIFAIAFSIDPPMNGRPPFHAQVTDPAASR